MKKIIPILSLSVVLLCLQNCTHRDDEMDAENTQPNMNQNAMMKREDSARSAEEIINPDPPVRDGDNWRLVHESLLK